MKRIYAISPFVFVLAAGLAQTTAKPAASNAADSGLAERNAPTDFPVRTLEFKALDSPANQAVSSVMTFPPECTSDGSLFLDMLDQKDLKQHTVLSIHGKDTKTYQVSAISGLNDITVFSFFPSDDTVGFLVRASKEKPGQPMPGRSPAGIAWKDYHNFIAEFDRSGQYKEAIQLPMDYILSRFAILSSGEFLVTGYDKLNSTVRLLFLKQSGDILRTLDMPSARDFATKNEPGDPVGSDKTARQLLGSVVFTPYKNDILVWRMNGSDAVLDVGPGGSAREVLLQPPSGEAFINLIPSTDGWIAHFRSEKIRENAAAYSQDGYSYYSLNPQDGSISSKLLLSGDVPSALSCESSGKYIAFKSQDSKVVILGSE
jgi:hypothetical protein